jgi:hypothetical protein
MSFIVLALQLSLLSTPAGVGATTVACTFDHADYAGQCVENTATEGDQTPVLACQAILSCVNDSRCVKTYCQSTTLRGGWKLVSAKPVDQ